MWQFSLYFPKALIYYIKNLHDNLKSICIDESCCIKIFSKDDGFVLILALPKKVYEKNILLIKEKIIEAILLYYKPKIIMQNIDNFTIENETNKILIDILCNFENFAESEIIFQKMNLNDKLYIESFVQFSLCELVKNWQEMAKLINQNTNFLQDQSVKFDLMRFLLNGISSKANQVTIKAKENCAQIFKDGKHIQDFSKVFYLDSNYDEIMFFVISQFPNQIKIENYKNFDVNFIDNMYSLFGDKIKFLE